MKKKHSIGSIIIVSLLILVLIVSSKAGYSNMQKKNSQTEEITEAEKITVITQGAVEKDDLYYLTELNGYVVVYREDKSTIYEYTNILVKDLPTELQSELEDWKQIEGIQQLYGFLENYSS